MSVTVIVPTVLGGRRLELLLDSLEDRPAWADVIVVDNGAGEGLDDLAQRRERVSVLSPGSNLGFGSAINLAVAQAPGEAIVLVNDDCVCDPGFVEAMVAVLDPAGGVTMAAGIMRDPAAPEVIDSAGIDVDRSLLAFDYMNGESIEALAAAADPLGPSGVAAAFDKAAFLAVGGFDEHLFAYQEDVDLALRMRQAGGTCVLAREAWGVHAHSGTLGTGPERNYLTGFGRGYLLRKWSVIRSPAMLARVLVADTAICLGQLIADRSLTGVRGRIVGLSTSVRPRPYPRALIDRHLQGSTLPGALARRARRRRRERSRRPGNGDSRPSNMVVLHTSEVGGPLRSLERELDWLAAEGDLTVVVPAGGPPPPLPAAAHVERLRMQALLVPEGLVDALREMGRLLVQTLRFARLVRRVRPDLVIVVTTVLPGAALVARMSGANVIVYAAELNLGSLARGARRRLVGGLLLRLTAATSDAVIACSRAVAGQFRSIPRLGVSVVYPPIDERSRGGDGSTFRTQLGIDTLPVVLAVGNVARGRGQDQLVRAVAHVQPRLGPMTLVVVGSRLDRPKDRAFEAELRELAPELGVELVLAGDRESLADAYAAASVVVNPAVLPESFGRVVCEALVAGTPAISTRVGAVPEALSEVDGVTLVEPGSPRALGAALLKVMEDPGAPALAARGGDEILARYRPAESLASFRRVVTSLLES
jgi:N-acetylglucosaminyl-diphospho-decaprenol L-rhamnosyltransferase